MRRALWVSAAILAGYVAGAILGYLAVQGFSPNTHDRSLEAAMTAILATGPIGAALGAICGFVLSRSR